MTDSVTFPTEIPNGTPVSGDRILFSKTSESGTSYDANVDDLPVSAPAASAIAAVQSDVDTHEARTDNPHSVTKSQIGLGNADNTSDLNKPVSNATQAALDSKVDKVTGKGLSTEDYSTAEKSKLAGIQAGAQVNSVDSVNGQTGAVSIDTDDIPEGVAKYDKVVAILAGAGISVTGTYPNFTVTNTSPDVAVNLIAGANVTITGTYPNFTIASTGGGGVGGGHVIQDEGVSLTQRAKLNFVGAGVTATDDAGNDATIVTIPSVDVSGFVTGPASSTDNALARYDLTTGKLVQNSAVTIDDAANMAGINEIHFVLSPTPSAYSEGTLRWNNTDHCLDIETGEGTTLQVGQEMFVRVRNSTGSTITNGSLCYINGATGNRPTVALAKADEEATAHTLIGMATEDILNNADGFITINGTVHDLNTLAYSDGAELFLSASTAGAFTNVAPTSPNYVVKIGVVSRSNASVGQVLIQTQVRTMNANNIRGTVGIGNGGTGLSALGTALQQLRVNAGATSLEYFTPSASGLSWNTSVNGATGTGLALALDNSYAASGIGQSITIGNTQTNALTGLNISTGTSAVGHTGLLISTTNASTSARGITISPSTTATGYGIYINERGASGFKGIAWDNINGIGSGSGAARYGIYQSIISTGSTANSGYGIYQGTIQQNAFGSASGIYQSIVSSNGGSGYGLYQSQITATSDTRGSTYGWYVANIGDAIGGNTGRYFSLNNAQSSATLQARTNDASEILWSRTGTHTTGTIADSFNLMNLRRTTVQNGAGGTLTSAGSVLRLENVATQTAGTLTDTTDVLLLNQSGAGTGNLIKGQSSGSTVFAVNKSGVIKNGYEVPPQGYMTNGKIVPSVATNNLTIALKTLSGTDPSATDPVYVRIGDAVRTVTSALSVTKAAGTNWFNSGSTELATLEIDYFAYLGFNATDGVVIGFSRIPYANSYGDFSTTTTNERYAAISTITNAASTDNYENVGRFAATLTGTATFNWSVPTYTPSNLIQRPIFETRPLTWLPTITGFSALPTSQAYKYKIIGRNVWVNIREATNGTSNAAGYTYTLPFSTRDFGFTTASVATVVRDNGTASMGFCVTSNAASNVLNIYKDGAFTGFTASGGKRVETATFNFEI